MLLHIQKLAKCFTACAFHSHTGMMSSYLDITHDSSETNARSVDEDHNRQLNLVKKIIPVANQREVRPITLISIFSSFYIELQTSIAGLGSQYR